MRQTDPLNAIDRTLKITDLEAFKADALRKGEMTQVCQCREQIETYQTQLAQVQTSQFHLRAGLSVDVFELKSDYSIQVTEQHEAASPLTLAFTLAGRSRILTEGIHQNNYYYETAGESHLFYLAGTEEIEESTAGEYYQTVRLRLTLDTLKSFGLEQTAAIPADLQPLMTTGELPIFHRRVGKISSVMRLTLHQILNCPYQGITKQIYLESKVLELIALQFGQLTEVDLPTRSEELSAREVDCIYQARDILILNSQAPPSLMGLAHQVGLNDRKLKQGFKQVFNATVFGYLWEYRMQQAQTLLLNRDMTVAGVAAKVGYKSPTSFSTAFQRKFGLSPKAYQLSL
ncbi:MAG: AraC family transcriptional regulator [Cyanobacteria bacterium P01_D01_bin.44]